MWGVARPSLISPQIYVFAADMQLELFDVMSTNFIPYNLPKHIHFDNVQYCRVVCAESKGTRHSIFIKNGYLLLHRCHYNITLKPKNAAELFL